MILVFTYFHWYGITLVDSHIGCSTYSTNFQCDIGSFSDTITYETCIFPMILIFTYFHWYGITLVDSHIGCSIYSTNFQYNIGSFSDTITNEFKCTNVFEITTTQIS